MTAAVSGCSVPSAGSGPLERPAPPASGSGKSLFRSLPLLQRNRECDSSCESDHKMSSTSLTWAQKLLALEPAADSCLRALP